MDIIKSTLKSSQWVWNKLREARNHNYQIGEESITDFVVLGLKKWGKEDLLVKTFSKHEESRNGADWEIWLTGTTGKWLGIRVQAKVLNLKKESYDHIHYKIKSFQPPQYQIDILKESAQKKGLIPLYCLYSNWDPKKYKILYYQCKIRNQSVRDFGTSIMRVSRIQNARPKTSLSEYLQSLIPLHCVFCNQCSTWRKSVLARDKNSASDLPIRAFDFLKLKGFVFDSIPYTDAQPYNVNYDVEERDKSLQKRLLRNVAPRYVKSLYDGDTKRLREELSEDKQLSKIMIIEEQNESSSSTDIDQISRKDSR